MPVTWGMQTAHFRPASSCIKKRNHQRRCGYYRSVPVQLYLLHTLVQKGCRGTVTNWYSFERRQASTRSGNKRTPSTLWWHRFGLGPSVWAVISAPFRIKYCVPLNAYKLRCRVRDSRRRCLTCLAVLLATLAMALTAIAIAMATQPTTTPLKDCVDPPDCAVQQRPYLAAVNATGKRARGFTLGGLRRRRHGVAAGVSQPPTLMRGPMQPN